jgi:hypothetical protein
MNSLSSDLQLPRVVTSTLLYLLINIDRYYLRDEIPAGPVASFEVTIGNPQLANSHFPRHFNMPPSEWIDDPVENPSFIE